MSDITVKSFAEVVGIPVDRLILQLKDAGINVKSGDSSLTEEQKFTLLGHLRKRHGKPDDENSPSRVTLRRKSVSTLKQGKGPGPAGKTGKTVSIEVRKKKTYVKRSEVDTIEASDEKAQAQKALDEQRSEIAAEEHARLEKDRLREAEKTRVETDQRKAEELKKQEVDEHQLHLDSQAHLKHEEDKRRHEVQKQKSDQERLVEKEDAKKKLEQEEKKTKEVDAKKNKPVQGATRQPSKPQRPAAKKGRGRAGAGGKRFKGSGRGRKPVVTDSDNQHGFEKPTAQVTKEVTIPEHIIVSELALRLSIKAADVIKVLMKLGTMATINQSIDQDTAVIIVEELGHKAILQNEDDIETDVLGLDDEELRESQSRAPIVTIMGHVDHGKTSLLDYIRKSRVADGEAGGITQHIGAYQVVTDHGAVTFLDTPGHAAFTAMRARGAQVTDVVIIVVAADDGVMPQTKEAVEHAKAADVPIIVAINKMDKAAADPQRVMQELATIDVVPEDWGGTVQFIQVSAKTGEGVDALIEALILQSEILELAAPVEGIASGFAIEARLDKGRGPVATVIVQKGTLEKGQIVLCGSEYGRIRNMLDESGKVVKLAGPSVPVEIVGLSGAPTAGEHFIVVANEKAGRELAEHRAEKFKSNKLAAQQATKLEEVYSRMEAGDTTNLNLVIKADVHGSLEAIRESLIKLSNDEVKVKVVYGGVGGINESDANLALASDAIVIGFNVRADATARRLIADKGIDLHYYSIIYDVIDEVKKSISGLLAPEIKEQIVGIAEVRDVFRSPKLGAIAGCMVVEGFVRRNLPIRVLRDNVVIYEGQLESLRRFKDDIQEVKLGMECGIGVKNYNDVKSNDFIEVFERIEVKREI
ncbi:MAG TPA: translation initiation factor IF-2 [Methylococcaceae bacterium]|nr:translation initiation factor IF-2 [Methylococcaceae bacterium]